MSMLFNLLHSFSYFNINELDIEIENIIENLSFDLNESITSFTDKCFENFSNLKFNHLGTSLSIEYISDKIKYYKDLISFLNNEIEKIIFIHEDGLGFNYSVSREFSLDKIQNLVTLHLNSKGFRDILDFSWRNLSSGEQSLFSLFSRFYDFRYHQVHNMTLDQNIIILIDEGDIYFHPEWQKRFFKITIDFLSELFSGHQIQLIYTSNTPFITSDLPKSNIIFIEKNEDKSINVLSQMNDREETFGGNIHTLFSDTFYLKGALMGEFAKVKINTIIDYLNEVKSESRKGKSSKKEIEIDQTKKVSTKKTIDIIGEPILKKKLQEMWYEVYGIDDEIDVLKERIKELEKKKNDKNR